ncbi:ricin-type beta-trefoil lectin domain protein [Streptomyces sp. NPDC005805]|uniref:ricin-type beta-trefoil lectin domain protein n=1 Tax=Streptomyces sp. NPDC005805 TaxID=3157068 RepID=UPI0033FBAC17
MPATSPRPEEPHEPRSHEPQEPSEPRSDETDESRSHEPQEPPEPRSDESDDAVWAQPLPWAGDDAEPAPAAPVPAPAAAPGPDDPRPVRRRRVLPARLVLLRPSERGSATPDGAAGPGTALSSAPTRDESAGPGTRVPIPLVAGSVALVCVLAVVPFAVGSDGDEGSTPPARAGTSADAVAVPVDPATEGPTGGGSTGKAAEDTGNDRDGKGDQDGEDGEGTAGTEMLPAADGSAPGPSAGSGGPAPAEGGGKPGTAAPPHAADTNGTAGGGAPATGTSGDKPVKAKPTTAEPAVPAPGRMIRSNAAALCIEIAAHRAKDGSPLRLAPCTGAKWQKWDFRSDGSVRSLGLCMDVADASFADGAALQVAVCNGGNAQRFDLNGAFDLVSLWSYKCVDIKDNVVAGGTPLQQWQCAGTGNQKWRLR